MSPPCANRQRRTAPWQRVFADILFAQLAPAPPGLAKRNTLHVPLCVRLAKKPVNRAANLIIRASTSRNVTSTDTG